MNNKTLDLSALDRTCNKIDKKNESDEFKKFIQNNIE